MPKLNENDMGSVSASNIAGNRGYSIFGQKSAPMKRIVSSGSDNVPVIKYQNDSRKLKSYKRKGLMYSFGNFLSATLGSATNENFNLSDALSKINGVAKAANRTTQNTVQFGLEDDKGSMIKVFVDAENADAFEKALQYNLETDMKKVEIAELLFSMRDEFNITNVVWPKIVDDAVEEEETTKQGNMEGNMEQEFGESGDEQGQGNDQSKDPKLDTTSDEQRGTGEERGAHDAGEDDVDVNTLPQQDALSGADDQKQTLSAILAMLSSDAEAKKADADARAAEARAKEAEAMARAAEAKIKSEEQILDMESYNKQQSSEKVETRKLAKLAKYRHDLKKEQEPDPLTDDVIDLDPDQRKRFEEEENHISKLDGKSSNNSISIDTLMKIARQMQAHENAQE